MNFPSIIPTDVSGKMYLRELLADATLGDIKCEVSHVVGSVALLVEVKIPGRDRVSIMYSLGEHIEAIIKEVERGS